jgi:hypothetical protein
MKVPTLAGATSLAALEELSSPQATKEAIATAAKGKRIFFENIVTPVFLMISRQFYILILNVDVL